MGRLVLNPWDFLRQIVRSGLRETGGAAMFGIDKRCKVWAFIRLGLADLVEVEEGQSDGYRIRIKIQILLTFELTNDRGSKVSPDEELLS